MASTRRSKAEMEREKVIQNRLQELLTRMLQDEDNKYCVDCDAKGPRWASWNIGIFVCIRCAGIHRNLGVHISKVKSVNLDSWTPHQVACMQIMGNSKARAVYEANVPEGFRRPQADAQMDVFIRAKYEKKKYVAREWVPIKAPELPEGWTALIEAEKQKKDIRSIVLPSHTNASEEPVKRERQSPKEAGSKKSTTTSPAASGEKKTQSVEKSKLESDFDLLSLSQQSSSTKPITTSSSAVANDLLCLGGDTNSSEFDDFVGAKTSTSSPPQSANSVQNGGTTSASSNNQHFFDDFNASALSGTEEKKQAMSKDSIMALFNQKPAMTNPAASTTSMFPNQQPQPGGFMPNNVQIPGGMPLGGNLGLMGGGQSNVGLLAGLGQPQPFQQPGGGNMGFGGLAGGAMNNPFLAMTQPSSDHNNVFGKSGFSATSTGTNRNLLQ